MIGKLSGIIDIIDNDHIIIDVGGVGYIVHCSIKTLANMPLVGEKTSLLINTQVKEDDISLYGFLSSNEQEWFNNLITVQGIGPRMALVILSAIEIPQLVDSINQRNKESFKYISGVGPKLAERIFTELNKKASQYMALYPNVQYNQSNNNLINDALLALTNLGYSRIDAQNTCKKLCSENPEISLNDLVRSALKELSNL